MMDDGTILLVANFVHILIAYKLHRNYDFFSICLLYSPFEHRRRKRGEGMQGIWHPNYLCGGYRYVYPP